MKNEEGLKFALVVGVPYGRELAQEVPVGFAIQPHGKSHFSVRPWVFPRLAFYLVPHSGGSGKQLYTLFGRKVELSSGAVHFQNPIGQGELSDRLPGYIDVRVRFPSSRFYVCLLGPFKNGDDNKHVLRPAETQNEGVRRPGPNVVSIHSNQMKEKMK